MSRLDLTCHNYNLVVQYKDNDSVYCCSLYICPEKVRGEHLCQHLPDSSTKTPTSSDIVKYIQLGIYKWMQCGAGGGITQFSLCAYVIIVFSGMVHSV